MPAELGHESVIELIDKIEDFSHFQEKAAMTSGIEHIWQVFVKDLERILPFDIAALFLVNEESHEFDLKAVVPDSKREDCLRELDLQIECGVFAWVIGRRHPAVLPSIVFKKKKALLLPLCTANRTIGAVLAVTGLEESAITMETLKLIGVLTRQCSLVIENAFLYEHVRREHESLLKAQAQIIQTEKLASIGRLTRAASHEILNPLNIISGYAHLLLVGAGEDSKPARYLKEIIKESARIAKVVSGLMQFKAQNGSRPSPLNINEVIEKALSLTEYAARFNKVSLTFERAEALPTVKAEPEELLQVIVSVINNALEAMPEGGRLEITTRVAGFEAGPRKGFVEVAISDTGCGIPADIQDKIFEPFFTTREDGALGLGLYLSYCVVERIGGEIRVKSGDGGPGTKVSILLPAMAED